MCLWFQSASEQLFTYPQSPWILNKKWFFWRNKKKSTVCIADASKSRFFQEWAVDFVYGVWRLFAEEECYFVFFLAEMSK